MLQAASCFLLVLSEFFFEVWFMARGTATALNFDGYDIGTFQHHAMNVSNEFEDPQSEMQRSKIRASLI